MTHHKLECERCHRRVSDRNYYTDERCNSFGGWGLVLCGTCAGVLEKQPNLTEDEYIQAIKAGPTKKSGGVRKPQEPKKTGTCQACLRTVKLTGQDTVMRHGWDFEHHGDRTGVHLGRCPGTSNEPLEKSCELAKSLIANRNFRMASIKAVLSAGLQGARSWELNSEFNILQHQVIAIENGIHRFHPDEMLDDRPIGL